MVFCLLEYQIQLLHPYWFQIIKHLFRREEFGLIHLFLNIYLRIQLDSQFVAEELNANTTRLIATPENNSPIYYPYAHRPLQA